MHILALILATLISTPPREWRDSIRDVYVDGTLVRNAQTLTTSSPRMIAVVCGEEVLLLDPEKQSVTRAPKFELAFKADRTSATSAAEVSGPVDGSVVQSGSTYIVNSGGKSIVVAPHQSKAGSMTIDELWATAPVWRAIADHYEPEGAIVDRLKAIDRPVRLEVVLATWCGDSRQHVPRLLKSVARAANPNITVELIGIDADFLKPAEVIAGRNITNVPTVIVSSADAGVELGRFVETPANATLEDDICDIVAGTQKVHPGRLERGALLASGTYELRDTRRRREGTETFEIYARPAGGVIAHSVIVKRDGTSIETWASPTSVEVTHRVGGTVSAHRTTTRTRFRRDGDGWTALSRGATGIIEQTVSAPAAYVAPATITYAWTRDAQTAYVVPERGVGAVSALQVRMAKGDVPKWVKFGDGSERRLLK
ncbi:MAG TPA: thioredoxin family protein [Thermoanaerobaculia bacterium]|nr:thioredoxin family protein [Thermoanaerobaculia bacterium]